MEMKKDGLFDHLKYLSQEKQELDDYKEYQPFITHRFLSMQYDTVLMANEMNKLFGLPKKFQYLFLLHTIKAKKRFFKYYKKAKDEKAEEEIKQIQEYYGVSEKVAIKFHDVLALCPGSFEYIAEYLGATGGK